MKEKDDIDKMISDEELRLRIRRIIPEQKQSELEKLSRHPLTTLMIGFLLTWGIGGLLTDKLKQRDFENQRRLNQINEKRKNDLLAINKITELMYDRYTTLYLLYSSLKVSSPIEELKEQKNIYNGSFLTWNRNVQNTLLTIRGLTSDVTYTKIESAIEFKLIPHYRNLDNRLIDAYQARIKNQKWSYDSVFFKNEFKCTLDCSYAISNYLWIRANVYEDEKLKSSRLLKRAEDDLSDSCK